MTRPLSPDSSRIAADLIDQHYGAEPIAATLNNMRTQPGQDVLPEFGLAYEGWARTHLPVDPGAYAADDVRAFRQNLWQSRAAISATQPAFAGMPSRGTNASVHRLDGMNLQPVPFANPAAPDVQMRRESPLPPVSATASASAPALASSFAPAGHLGIFPAVDYSTFEDRLSQTESVLGPRMIGRKRNEKMAYTTSNPIRSSNSPVSGPTAPVKQPRSTYVQLMPVFPEHTALMNTLPEGQNGRYRSCVNRFLCCLEQNNQCWSDWVPAERQPGWRSSEFEKELDAATKNLGLHTATRAALNNSFGLSLKPSRGNRWRSTLELEEHIALIAALPEKADLAQVTIFRRFLRYLEKYQRSWSQLLPDNLDMNEPPVALQDVLNLGIDGVLPEYAARSTINRLFGMSLRGKSGIVRLTAALPEHQDLLTELPNPVSTPYHSLVNRFLCYIEQRLQSWSQLTVVGDGDANRPLLLEAAINDGIRDGDLNEGTRAAVNQAFGFVLKGIRQ
jgi:hypothetical protein